MLNLDNLSFIKSHFKTNDSSVGSLGFNKLIKSFSEEASSQKLITFVVKVICKKKKIEKKIICKKVHCWDSNPGHPAHQTTPQPVALGSFSESSCKI